MLAPSFKSALQFVAFLAGILAASEAPARGLQPRDLWTLARSSDLQLSPSGKSACYAVKAWSIEGNTATAHLWLVDIASSQARELTTGDIGTDASPVWSPDGERIAFVSKRAGDSAPALYIVRVSNCELTRVVAPPLGASLPQWMPDGKSLVFVTRVFAKVAPVVTTETLQRVASESTRRNAAPLRVHVAEGGFYRFDGAWLPEDMAHRLVRVVLDTRQLIDLTPQYDRLFSPRGATGFSIAPNGTSLVIAVNRADPRKPDENDEVILVPTDGSGRWRILTSDNPRGDSMPRFSPNGRYVLFGRRTLEIYAGENTKLFRHELATGKNTPLLEQDLSFSAWRYSPDGSQIVCVANRAGVTPVFRCDEDGKNFRALTDAGTAEDPQMTGDGTLLFLRDDSKRPPEVFALAPTERAPRALTAINTAKLGDIEFGRIESHNFKGADGDGVQMWVVFPPNYEPTKRYPLIQLLHGGPQMMAGDTFSFLWNAHAFAATGCIVAMVNRHGSTGFGEKFARSVVGDWRSKALTDVLKGTEYLVATLPSIDAKRMAACGVSYGGYLVAALAGETDRFACLVTHAGISDLDVQYGSDLAAQLAPTFGGYPWEEQERYRNNNPVARSANFRTPTLILQGGRDTRVPEANAFALYGILQTKGVPSRLVYFPDETHWVQTPQNSIYWYQEVFAWLARWLKEARP